MPEASNGGFCDVGGSYFLPRIHDLSVGLYLGITGQRIKAKDLVNWGIATHYIPRNNLPDLVNSIKANVTTKSSNKEITDIVNNHAERTASHAPKIPDYDEIKDIF